MLGSSRPRRPVREREWSACAGLRGLAADLASGSLLCLPAFLVLARLTNAALLELGLLPGELGLGPRFVLGCDAGLRSGCSGNTPRLGHRERW